jgi:hypothetical protein
MQQELELTEFCPNYIGLRLPVEQCPNSRRGFRCKFAHAEQEVNSKTFLPVYKVILFLLCMCIDLIIRVCVCEKKREINVRPT